MPGTEDFGAGGDGAFALFGRRNCGSGELSCSFGSGG